MTVETANGNARGSAAAIFNSTVAAWAICAAWELGALDELRSERKLDAVEFAARHCLDTASTIGMFRALAAVDVVQREGSVVTVSSNFDEMYRTKSFFHWLCRGSAELFRQMPSVLVNEKRVGNYYQRDPAAISFACREINAICYDSTFWSAMHRLNFDFGVVADLGCGSGGRVMNLLAQYPGARGVGIDIARPSLEAARAEAARLGLADRATFIEADVRYLDRCPEFDEVDLLTCFMMGHDFWPRENCVATLRRLREVFPAARRFLLGDATRTVGIPDADLPVFTLGFELAHDLMGIFVPTLDDWESVFEESGWQVIGTNRIEMTVGEVIFELG